jgi:hypothetical protein
MLLNVCIFCLQLLAYSNFIALLLLPASSFGSNDPAVRELVNQKPKFKSDQWCSLTLAVTVLAPIRTLIRKLV